MGTMWRYTKVRDQCEFGSAAIHLFTRRVLTAGSRFCIKLELVIRFLEDFRISRETGRLRFSRLGLPDF
jgi:hypothetical protein